LAPDAGTAWLAVVKAGTTSNAMAKAAGFRERSHHRADRPSMPKNFVVTPDDIIGSLEQIRWPESSLGSLASATKAM
jgi:hypothetical protein